MFSITNKYMSITEALIMATGEKEIAARLRINVS